jgi:hypothetical protein
MRPAIFDPDRSCQSSVFEAIPRACQDLLTDPYLLFVFLFVPYLIHILRTPQSALFLQRSFSYSSGVLSYTELVAKA